MSTDILKVPKIKHRVSLWVHPEGQVIGSLFVREQSPDHAGPEDPIEVLNQQTSFLVFEKNESEELRFYNRNSIIRVEYQANKIQKPDTDQLSCTINMMDGSVIEGTIRENLPPDHSRLFDYINQENSRFIKIYFNNDDICLINKSYIVNITTTDS